MEFPMLLSYGANNFHCFKEGIDVSLRLGKSVSKDISHGKPYSTVLGFKGANGSGKSNALKAFHFLSDFCAHSFSYEPEQSLPFASYFNSKKTTFLYADFLIGTTEYHYEVELTKSKILKEVLSKKKKRSVPIIERKNDKITYTTKEYNEIKKIKIRNNASFISTAHQYNMDSIKDIYFFFYMSHTRISDIEYSSALFSLNKTSEYYYNEPKSLDFTKNILKQFDLGIDNIIIEERLDENDDKIYMPFFSHKNQKKDYKLPYKEESSGTKSLYKQLIIYNVVLNTGGLLLLDEFDINLHPDILPLLIELFTDPKKNKKEAQLLFTTHDSKILDILGKYRTVLVNKDENESFLYRLDEIPGDIIRNDRGIEQIYRSGKIGGVPRV